jgi:hypothetical protein
MGNKVIRFGAALIGWLCCISIILSPVGAVILQLNGIWKELELQNDAYLLKKATGIKP